MTYDDLREFLKALDEQGQLLRITDEVMPEPDIAAAANAAKTCELGLGGRGREGKQQQQRSRLAHHLVSSGHGSTPVRKPRGRGAIRTHPATLGEKPSPVL